MRHILSKLEKKMNINFRSNLANTLYIMGGGVIALISNLAISVALANYLSPTIYGSYKYIQSMASVISAFSLTQTATVITRSVARGYEGAWKEGAARMLIWSVLPAAIGAILSGYYLLQTNYILASSLFIACILAPLGQVARLYGPYLAGKQLFNETFKNQIVRSTVPAATLITTSFYSESTLSMVTAFFLSYLVTDSALSFHTYLKYRPNSKQSETDNKFTKHLSFMNLLSTGANHLDKVLLFQFVGASDLAVYAIATAIPEQTKMIPTGLKSLLYPKISKQTQSQLEKTLPLRGIQITTLLIIILGLYVVAAPFIFTYLFPKYVGGILISQVYAIGMTLAFSMPYRLALTANEKTKSLYIIDITSAAVKILLTFVLVTHYGIWGAVWSVVLTKLVAGTLTVSAFYAARKET